MQQTVLEIVSTSTKPYVTVPFCSKLHQPVPLYQTLPMHQTVTICTEMNRSVQTCIKLYQSAICIKLYQHYTNADFHVCQSVQRFGM